MVVSDTALPYVEQPSIDPIPLKLDYNNEVKIKDNEKIEKVDIVDESIQNKNIEIINETEIIDDISFEDFTRTTNQIKTVEIPLTSGVETGLEIQFTSLKLKEFPIIETNISPSLEQLETVNLNTTNVSIGDFVLYNVGVKIFSYAKFKVIEFKTREFKIALSVGLYEDNILRKDGDYFYYEIFSKVKNSRLLSICDTFKKVFSGETISFEINNLKGEILFENRIQYHKFTIIENAVNIFQDVTKKLKITKNKNFSETTITFYTLYLLDQLLKGNTKINSWINFGIDNSYNINIGDSIVFSKVHNLSLKGINFNLKETVRLKEPVTAMELEHVKNRVTCYKKTVTIELEKIEK